MFVELLILQAIIRQLNCQGASPTISKMYTNETRVIHFLSLHRLNRSISLKAMHNHIIATGDREQFARYKGNVKEYFTWHAPLPTIGKPWPQPLKMYQKDKISLLHDNSIFVMETSQCALMKLAIDRYTDKIFKSKLVTHVSLSDVPGPINDIACVNLPDGDCYVRTIYIQVEHCSHDDWPSADMNETYTLSANDKSIRIQSREVWGLLRALETLSHLVYCILTGNKRLLAINQVFIRDSPKYSYRGLLLDTSRHYIPLDDILLTLNGMEMNKLNVFHWHLTDDQSFPFISQQHPELHENGAYDLSMTYNHSVIRIVVQYARERGIRVIPEIDVPGHTESWSKSHPELMSQCTESNGQITAFGPLNPILRETFNLLTDLYQELVSLFPEKYIHIGMDEVGFACWNSDVSIRRFMAQYRIRDHRQLTNIFILELQRIINEKFPDKTMIVWQEAFERESILSNNTIIQVWKSPLENLQHLRQNKYPLIYSTNFYLDQPSYGPQWVKMYLNDFGNNHRTDFIGGEACMWNEFQSKETIHQTIWPAASAVAEKLWFGSAGSLEQVGSRLEEHRCHMLRNGMHVGVGSGPSECLHFQGFSIAYHTFKRREYETTSREMFKYYFPFAFGLIFGYLFRIIRSRWRQYAIIILLLPIVIVVFHLCLQTSFLAL